MRDKFIEDDGRWLDSSSAAFREDGLSITKGLDGEGLVIRPTNNRLAITECPCCGKAFETLQAARLVADMIFPTEARVRAEDRADAGG